MRKTKLERLGALYELYLLFRERDSQRVEVFFEQPDVKPADSDSRENVGHLLYQVRNGDAADALDADLCGNLLQSLQHCRLLVIPRRISLSGIIAYLAPSEHIPWREREAILPGHADDVPLEGAVEHASAALVHAERGLVRHARVLVRRGHDPRRRVRDGEVEDLPGGDERVEVVHEPADARAVIPPVDIQDVDVLPACAAFGDWNRR